MSISVPTPVNSGFVFCGLLCGGFFVCLFVVYFLGGYGTMISCMSTSKCQSLDSNILHLISDTNIVKHLFI